MRNLFFFYSALLTDIRFGVFFFFFLNLKMNNCWARMMLHQEKDWAFKQLREAIK